MSVKHEFGFEYPKLSSNTRIFVSKYNVLVQDTKFCLSNIVYVVFTDFLKMNILDAVQDINTEWTVNGQDYIEDMDSSPPNELVINVFRYGRLLKVVQV